MADDNDLAAGTGQGDVQLAVDELAVVVGEGGGSQEVELVAVADGEIADDDIALAALIALYCVDGHLLQLLLEGGWQGLADQGYLAAVEHDDADGLRGVEM